MTSPDTIQGIELPNFDDPPAIPDDMRVIFYALMARANPRFSNVAARDTAYPVPADGQMCTTGSGDLLVRWVGLGGQWVQEVTSLQMQQRPLYQAGFVKAGAFSHTSASTTVVGIPALDVWFNAVTGHRYRITSSFTTHSSNVADVAGIFVYTKLGAGSFVQRGSFTRQANSSPTLVGTGNYQTVFSYFDADADGECQVTHQFSRAAGSGTVTASSSASTPAAVLVEDMGLIP